MASIFFEPEWLKTLPTEPGRYEVEEYPVSGGYNPYVLGGDGQWSEVNKRTGLKVYTLSADSMASLLPVRLVDIGQMTP